MHAKLLEIYANRKDLQSFETTALKLKALTNGAGPDWDKAAALGRSIDPQNGLYGGPAAAPDITSPGGRSVAAAAAAATAPAPALDFDLGTSSQQAQAPDISLDEPVKDSNPSTMDFDLGTPATAGDAKPGETKGDFTPEGTLIMGAQEPEKTVSGLDFDLSGTEHAPAGPAAAQKPADAGGLDFDLDIDTGSAAGPASPDEKSAPPPDLSMISLDLDAPGEAPGGTDAAGTEPGTEPKWQEVATKLDLAKAYEEMGDKDGARELLNEVMKDGDAAQKGQAEQLLGKLA